MDNAGSPLIRRAAPADADAVARIHIESRAVAMPWLAVVHSVEETLAHFRHVVLPRDEVWVACDGDRILGFAAFADDFLDHLYVTPAAQCRGVGSALLERVKQRRPAGFGLYVFQRNVAARRFYERHGCRLISTSDGAVNQEREPDALYHWP